ncbi:hypothetical protein BH09PAT1_BH09PAT1_8160 [soil metagenome]
MVAKFQSHKVYYLLLVGMEALGFVLVLFAKGDKQLELTYIVLATFFYLIWALVHHYIHHDLHTKVVIEYCLLSALGIAVMFFFLR